MRKIALTLTVLLVLSMFASCAENRSRGRSDGDDDDHGVYGDDGVYEDLDITIDRIGYFPLSGKIQYVNYYEAPTVNFTKDGISYCGIIHNDGEIFYYVQGDELRWTYIGNGAGYVTSNADDGKTVYDVVNAEGEVVATSKNGDFDRVIGYGEGLLLVYKNTGNMTQREHRYGVIDSSDGSWRSQMTPSEELPINSDSRYFYQYYGDGIFITSDIYKDECVMYNSNTSESFLLEDACMISDYSFDGLIYGASTKTRGGSICNLSDPDSSETLPGDFSLSANGIVKEVREYSHGNGRLMSGAYDHNEYITMYDMMNGTSFEYTAAKSDSVRQLQFCNDLIVAYVTGADGKSYINVINFRGEEVFDPVSADLWNTLLSECGDDDTSNDRIVYKGPEDKYFTVIDLQGNTLVSGDDQYVEFSKFADDGVAFARKEDGEVCFVGLDGEPVEITLRKTL